jgi:hypothetical protein
MKRSPMRPYHPKQRTKAEKAHHEAVAALGCVVCGGPAEVHHLKHDPITGQHMTRRVHRYVIPLCPMHHRQGGCGVAFHAGSNRWQSIYGLETRHWWVVQARLEIEPDLACSYCGVHKPIRELEPESGDTWVCWDCWDRMAEKDHTPVQRLTL